MVNTLLTVLAAYALTLGALYLFQRRLIYHPDKIIAAPKQYGLAGFSEHTATASDGVPIQLWHRPAAGGFPTIVYYHGNAFHMGNRAGIYAALADKGFGVLAVGYRGYGKSGGRPSEQGLYRDARAAIAFLNDKNIPPQRLLLFGESLGSGIAVQMAGEYDIGGLILEAPYTSITARAAEIYRFIPVRLMLRDRFDSLKKIGKVRAPLLLFHGERDDTIPVAHGRAILAAAISPKHGIFFPEGGHSDFDNAVISAHVSDFARKHGLIQV
ncbi:MAG: alpha/beta hydrolase [Pseudomonadota bacterium]|nr:alpha/beta hydrolase [Pseudomonadota bacterium]MDE3037614.1 alpha/beta hydrolase [Pseudomonadota bacterium]